MTNNHLLILLLSITCINYTHAMINEFKYEPIIDPFDLYNTRSFVSVWSDNKIQTEYLKKIVTITREATKEELEGKCIRYAINKITQSTAPIKMYDDATLNIDIEKFFEQTNKPQKNDLVIYTKSKNNPKIKHFAIVINDTSYESKWGSHKEIIQHSLFTLPAEYGNAASFWTLKEKFKAEEEKEKLPRKIEENVELLCNRQLTRIRNQQITRDRTIKIIIGGAVGIGLGNVLGNILTELFSNNK